MSDLKRARVMAEQLRDKKAEVEALEEQLKQAKAEHRALEREDLPQFMVEVGLSRLDLDDGTTIILEEDCEARISERNRAAAIKWLVDNGFGGLIKTEVAVRLPRGAHDEATQISDNLASQYDEVELKETVHPSTLKSFIKEQMAEGTAIPMDVFGVHPFSKATIKKVK